MGFFSSFLAGAAGRLSMAGERRLSGVTAQPMEDPTDPLVILRDLPERERARFYCQRFVDSDCA